MKVWVEWNDPVYIWGGSEDFLWNEAYRIVQEVLGALGHWDYRKKPWDEVKKKLKPELADKFLDVIVKVNGLTKTYKVEKHEKPNITIEHIEKTVREFSKDSRIKVKAEIVTKITG